MKTAKVIAIEFEVICPECEESVEDPDYGSYRWTTDETNAGQVVKCEGCGTTFKLPKSIPSRKLSEAL